MPHMQPSKLAGPSGIKSKCEVCAKTTTTRLTSIQCAGCLLLRQAKKREDEEARHHQQQLL